MGTMSLLLTGKLRVAANDADTAATSMYKGAVWQRMYYSTAQLIVSAPFFGVVQLQCVQTPATLLGDGSYALG